MLKQIAAALAFAAGLGLAQAQAAPKVSCRGEAKGPGQSGVDVYLDLDGKGQVVSRTVSWTPPSGEPGLFPIASLGYYGAGPVLAAPNRLGVFAFADFEKGAPRSDNVEVQAVVDGRAFQVPWRYYAANIAEVRRQLAHPGDRQLGGLSGAIPLAYQSAGDEPINPDILPLLAAGRTLEVRLNGDAAGESFGARTYDLTDLKARDALYVEAAAKAEAAARTPKTCQKR
jgi:hypothetical protein